MQCPLSETLRAMARYNQGHPDLVQHAAKVYAYSELIALDEGLAGNDLLTVQLAALLHDIGILPSREKYGSGAGGYQQIEGPPVATALLEPLQLPEPLVERVCFLIAHHHTYTDIDGLDYRILVEADFLVNIQEGGMDGESIRAVQRDVFRTRLGNQLLQAMFLQS